MVYAYNVFKTSNYLVFMVTVRCENINPIYWSWVVEYAQKRRIERCKALEMIIEEHMKFTKREYERSLREKAVARKKT